MRTWIYNRIVGLPNKPASLAALTMHSSAGADMPVPPFLTITMGVEAPPLGMTAESRTQEVPFTLWVHDKGGTMTRIDDASVWLKNELPTETGFKVGNLSVYRIKWEDTGADAYDDHFKTNTRPVRFSMMTRR